MLLTNEILKGFVLEAVMSTSPFFFFTKCNTPGIFFHRVRMVKIQNKKAEFTRTKHTEQYMTPTLFYKIIRTKPLHNSMVCLT